MKKIVSLLTLGLALAACQDGTPTNAPRSESLATPTGRGQAAAERVCGFCHQVVLTRPSAIEAAAPSFMEIANLPGRNRAYLRQFMVERHTVDTLGEPKVPMPTDTLTADEREDVIQYILSFQTDPERAKLPPTKLEPFE